MQLSENHLQLNQLIEKNCDLNHQLQNHIESNNLYTTILEKIKLDTVYSIIKSDNSTLNKKDIHFLLTEKRVTGNKIFKDFIKAQNYLNVIDYISRLIKLKSKFSTENIIDINNLILSDLRPKIEVVNPYSLNDTRIIKIVLLQLIESYTEVLRDLK